MQPDAILASPTVYEMECSKYASDGHYRLLAGYGMVQSMSRRAGCWDGAAMESFFKTFRVERVHRLN